MTITTDDVIALQGRINEKLARFNTSFKLTVHFTDERINSDRNHPAITIEELDSIFDRLLTDTTVTQIVALNHGDTFNIRCMTSHINMPCGVEKKNGPNNTVTHKSIVITVMRKEKFKAKDPIEFQV